MSIPVEIVLRGSNQAVTAAIEGVVRPPSAWIDDDVRVVLEGMLKAMDRLHRPGEDDRAVTLRGLSWIVNRYEEGGVVIALEITLGAAVAGPFEIEQRALEAMITRVIAQGIAVIAQGGVPASPSVH